MFKTPQHRRFDIKTRYYDAEAEARQERMRKLKAEVESVHDGSEMYQGKIREGFRKYRGKKDHISRGQSSVRIIIIAGLLAAISYLILK
jgi:hypothetical protein